MLETPTITQIEEARTKYKRGDRPWPQSWSEWHVVFEDGSKVPAKYLYGLAMNVRPRDYSTNSIKAALRPLGLNIINVVRDASNAKVTVRVADCEQRAIDVGAFDPTGIEDARDRVFSAIVRRQGQPAFRRALLEAYGGMCAITGCNLPAVLEAAHVHPYMGDHTNVVSNGLLLRADIHTLFDLQMIAIDPAGLTLLISPELDGTQYADLRGIPVRQPDRPECRISLEAIIWHRRQCSW